MLQSHSSYHIQGIKKIKISSKIRNKENMLTIATLTQYSTGSLSQDNKATTEIKSSNWKGKIKIISIDVMILEMKTLKLPLKMDKNNTLIQ